MATRLMTCPRCLASVRMDADAEFCPRCGLDGLADGVAAEAFAAGEWIVRVGRRLGVGDACNLYHCTFGRQGEQTSGVFKIARDASAGAAVTNGCATLGRLACGLDSRLLPFVPRPVTLLEYRAAGEAVARPAAVLAYDASIRTPDALYALAEVQQHYPGGVDARDMAWVWRRLLTVLGGIHALDLVHAAVTPTHVLIEPAVHGVVLVGWGAAVPVGAYPGLRTATYRDWFAGHPMASPGLDVKTAVRCMLALLAQHLPDPPPLEPALRRYFDRCLASPDAADPRRLLADFDRLIETLWGPRQFRPFTMPPRQAPA